MNTIININKITQDVDDCLVVDLEYQDENMEIKQVKHAYRASDPYGWSPLIKDWIAEHSPMIHPYVPPSPDEIRHNMPQLSMVDFRRTLRGIKVVEREGETELDGIYEEDILEKIAIISDKELQAEARDYFMFAQYIERINPWVEILGGMFDITPDEIDAFWLG